MVSTYVAGGGSRCLAGSLRIVEPGLLQFQNGGDHSGRQHNARDLHNESIRFASLPWSCIPPWVTMLTILTLPISHLRWFQRSHRESVDAHEIYVHSPGIVNCRIL